MLTKDLSVDSSENEINVSTLAKAAKLSHMINETTIGAFSRPHSKVPIETKDTMKVQRQHSVDPWKRDAWRSVNLEVDKNRTGGGTININDCKSIQMKLALKSAERMRQKQVRLEMAQRQNKLNELEDMMENLKINLIEKSATKLQKNLLLKEEQILQVCVVPIECLKSAKIVHAEMFAFLQLSAVMWKKGKIALIERSIVELLYGLSENEKVSRCFLCFRWINRSKRINT